MISEEKKKTFRKFLGQLADIHTQNESIDITKFNEGNNFSQMKINKLLFLVTMIDLIEYQNNHLLEIFDNWYAYPYGPVEENINHWYDELNSDNQIIITTNKMIINDPQISEIDDICDIYLSRAIRYALKINPDILAMSPNKLVNITQRYQAWKSSISIAKILGRKTFLMQKNQFKYGEIILDV